MTRMLLAAGLLAASAAAAAAIGGTAPAGRAAIRTLSTGADYVTGGDVLVQVTIPPHEPKPRITAGGRDVTMAFRAGEIPNVFVGLVSDLPIGRSALEVHTKTRGLDASLEVTNYPITGPVFSGPWQQPFICQTEAFKLPDGSTLGPPLDANCSAKTVVQYVYRTTGTPAAFKPLPGAAPLPADVARTKTATGAEVNFIVRVETGTMNRGIYQNAVLHDPTIEPPPTPFTPPNGWNRHLVALHGTGCPAGWYIQGAAMGAAILDAARLGRGDALFINTLNHPTNSCNAIVAAETAMMGKERFIETFGVPAYTISTGRSGGAYTSLQIADAFPGLFDGVSIGATFPDALSIALAGLDAHLLTHYFAENPSAFTDEQKAAISGYQGVRALVDAANQAQRTDPVPDRRDIPGYQSARFNAAVPKTLRYDQAKNPTGARPTIFDAAKNAYGVDPATGFGRRPYDNVGVQYGLNALNAGAITAAQFLELNERIGGFDDDANYVAARSVGDAVAIRRAYQSGLLLGGGGGLASIPIFDNASSTEASGYHYGWFHFALRERLRAANGSADNLVMWRSANAAAEQAAFDAWMAAFAADARPGTARDKAIRAKPPAASDGCYDKATPPSFIAETLVFSAKPVSKCTALYPVYSNTRHEAGGPLAANVIKCQLKPVDARDYARPLSADDLARLKRIFPGGVCDWSKPGVNQTAVVTWPSLGPSPRNRLAE